MLRDPEMLRILLQKLQEKVVMEVNGRTTIGVFLVTFAGLTFGAFCQPIVAQVKIPLKVMPPNHPHAVRFTDGRHVFFGRANRNPFGFALQLPIEYCWIDLQTGRTGGYQIDSKNVLIADSVSRDAKYVAMILVSPASRYYRETSATLSILSATTGKELSRHVVPCGETDRVSNVCFSPDSSAVGFFVEHTFHRCQVVGGKEYRKSPLPFGVWRFVFRSDDDLVLVNGSNAVYSFNLTTRKLLSTKCDPSTRIADVRQIGDGRLVTMNLVGDQFDFWDVDSRSAISHRRGLNIGFKITAWDSAEDGAIVYCRSLQSEIGCVRKGMPVKLATFEHPISIVYNAKSKEYAACNESEVYVGSVEAP